jgi:photosystem II stability/assembly factor-like uncharacterized protein
VLSADGGSTWSQPVGGLRGACTEVAAMGISPALSRDRTLFAALVGTGLFRSTDGGGLWQPASAGLPSAGISSIYLSPGFDRDQTLFVELLTGGLQRSTDGGDSWQSLGMDARVLGMSPDFDQDQTLLGIVATLERPDLRQLKLSRDGGDSWQALRPGLSEAGVSALSLAPLFARWGVAFAWTDQGSLYRTADGGATWSPVLTTGAGSYAQIAYAPELEQNRPVFVLVAARDPGTADATWRNRLYRSGDGGVTWQQIEGEGYEQITALSISPSFATDATLLFGTARGEIWLKTDPRRN